MGPRGLIGKKTAKNVRAEKAECIEMLKRRAVADQARIDGQAADDAREAKIIARQEKSQAKDARRKLKRETAKVLGIIFRRFFDARSMQ